MVTLYTTPKPSGAIFSYLQTIYMPINQSIHCSLSLIGGRTVSMRTSSIRTSSRSISLSFDGGSTCFGIVSNATSSVFDGSKNSGSCCELAFCSSHTISPQNWNDHTVCFQSGSFQREHITDSEGVISAPFSF